MTRVLLVTGSRTLAKHPGAEAWARGLIREALDGEDLRIVARGRSYDVLGEVDASSDAPETIDALVEAAWGRACG